MFMLLENLDRYKVSTTKAAVTSFAAVALVLGCAMSLALNGLLNGLGLKERPRGYEPMENVLALMGMLAAGGVAPRRIPPLISTGPMRQPGNGNTEAEAELFATLAAEAAEEDTE